jgi:hypothetical protein
MTTYRVRPLPDGVAQRGNWQVQEDRERVSTHTKKSAAENEARRRATQGDRIVLYRVDGTRNRSYRFQGSRGDGSDDERGTFAGAMFRPTPFDDVIEEPFDDDSLL